jgi:hypothetical protein
MLFFFQIPTIYAKEITDIEETTNAYIRYYSNIGFSVGKIIINNGYLPFLEDVIHDLDLAVLTKRELRILRNTIFAKHGMIFRSNDLTIHFSKFNWYRPLHNNVDEQLTYIDKINISNIQTFENMKPNNNFNKSDLVGKWLGSYPVASGYINHIIINNDNTIKFGYNEMHPKAARYCKGKYRIENGYLIVSITEQDICIGEYFHNGFSSVVDDMDGGNNYSMGKLEYEKPIKMVFPISDLKEKYYDEYDIPNRIIRQIGTYDRIKM